MRKWEESLALSGHEVERNYRRCRAGPRGSLKTTAAFFGFEGSMLIRVDPESQEVLDLSKEIARVAGKLTPARAWVNRTPGPGAANEPAGPGV